MQDLFEPHQGDIFDKPIPSHWIIESIDQHDDATGRRLTWSNRNGWGLDEATIFADRDKLGPLPMGGRWRRL